MITRGGYQLDKIPKARTQPNWWDRVIAFLIIASIGLIIVAVSVWFFVFELQDILNERPPLPEVKAPKPTTPDNFKP